MELLEVHIGTKLNVCMKYDTNLSHQMLNRDFKCFIFCSNSNLLAIPSSVIALTTKGLGDPSGEIHNYSTQSYISFSLSSGVDCELITDFNHN